jgi:hypothetical protein
MLDRRVVADEVGEDTQPAVRRVVDRLDDVTEVAEAPRSATCSIRSRNPPMSPENVSMSRQ